MLLSLPSWLGCRSPHLRTALRSTPPVRFALAAVYRCSPHIANTGAHSGLLPCRVVLVPASVILPSVVLFGSLTLTTVHIRRVGRGRSNGEGCDGGASGQFTVISDRGGGEGGTAGAGLGTGGGGAAGVV